MARRGGKAASRRSRQQRRAQQARQPQVPQASQPRAQEPETREPLEAEAAPKVDAFEAADAELRASTPPPGARSSGRSAPRSPARARARDVNLPAGSSRLTANAAAEYHYVTRDLRNIGVLVAVMIVLLAISAVVVNVLGVGV